MPLSMYSASVPVFVRMFDNMSSWLDKAEAHAQERGLAPAELIEARLAPDMLPLAGQVQRASDTAKFTGQRLSGVASPAFPDTETTFAELQARIAGTIAYLQGIDPAALDGAEDRVIEVKLGQATKSMTGADYLFLFALPNVFFHVTAAHAILRHKGVIIGKLDYLGAF